MDSLFASDAARLRSSAERASLAPSSPTTLIRVAACTASARSANICVGSAPSRCSASSCRRASPAAPRNSDSSKSKMRPRSASPSIARTAGGCSGDAAVVGDRLGQPACFPSLLGRDLAHFGTLGAGLDGFDASTDRFGFQAAGELAVTAGGAAGGAADLRQLVQDVGTLGRIRGLIDGLTDASQGGSGDAQGRARERAGGHADGGAKGAF